MSSLGLPSDTDILHGVQPTSNIGQQVEQAVQQVNNNAPQVPATVSAQAQPIIGPSPDVQSAIAGLKALTKPAPAASFKSNLDWMNSPTTPAATVINKPTFYEQFKDGVEYFPVWNLLMLVITVLLIAFSVPYLKKLYSTK